MALQSSGEISIADIAGEFGGTAPHALSEYQSETADGNTPIGMNEFYGLSALPTFTITVGSIDVTVKTTTWLFGYSDPSGFDFGSISALPPEYPGVKSLYQGSASSSASEANTLNGEISPAQHFSKIVVDGLEFNLAPYGTGIVLGEDSYYNVDASTDSFSLDIPNHHPTMPVFNTGTQHTIGFII